MEIRSKREITREIEATRRELNQAFRDAAGVLPGRRRVPTRNVTSDTLMAIRRQVAASAASIQHRATQEAARADEALHRKPYPFVIGAVAAGVLAGLLAVRKSRTP